ncbi:efflux RND transporter permease subunit [Vibrio sonorensis]|uniref:efflux RND transporter permease subunit n=1 Tax=Vibrio sonorensis TaxID=1004316 RepID=UPI000AE01D0B
MSWGFLVVVALLFIVAAALPALRLVPLKLLPYDNKNEFQIVVDLPETSSFTDTNIVLKSISDYLVTEPEVESVSGFAGLASPMDFNGMIRHYFLRAKGNQGEVRVVLADKLERFTQSHEIVTRLRPQIEKIALRHNAKVKLVELPPGPPVIATIVAEVYGQETTSYADIEAAANQLANRLKSEQHVSEVDVSSDQHLETWRFKVDQQKAALSGISVSDVNNVLASAVGGKVVAYLADEEEVNPLPVILKLPRSLRDNLSKLLELQVRGRSGVVKETTPQGLTDAPQPMVSLSELGYFVKEAANKPIYHKNLRPVVYVYAEPIGRVPGEVVSDLIADQNREVGSEFVPVKSRHYLNNGAGIGCLSTKT